MKYYKYNQINQSKKIKKSYRKLTLKYYPDLNQDDL